MEVGTEIAIIENEIRDFLFFVFAKLSSNSKTSLEETLYLNFCFSKKKNLTSKNNMLPGLLSE